MAALLLIQMSGVPGAGKSTLARMIGRQTGSVVLDHDVVKSALLEAGVPWSDAGRASYQTLQMLAKSLLDQDRSVVLDSPCFYQDLLNAGLRIAEETGACYRYVECVVDNFSEIDRRLRGRTSLRSQRAALDAPPASFSSVEAVLGEDLFHEWINNMKRPPHSYLRVDTSKPLSEYLPQVFTFLAECNGNEE